jgi:sigma-B regulation protein RsbU (phosphoserine phosphatase)
VNPQHRDEARRLILRRDLSELPRLARWLQAQAGADSSPDAVFAVSLCLEEAVANIIMHGFAEDEALKIAVEVERASGTWTARIEDNGRRFDPTQVPSPPVANSLKEAKVGNLGIDLIRDFASEMQYERREGCNRLTLRFLDSALTSRGMGS